MPVGILSAVFTLVILYLSLDPDPIKQPSFLSFYGADKIVHFLMYFALTSAYLFDYVILKYPHRTRTNKELALTAVAILLGGLIEVLQLYMGLGRSMSMGDFLADAAGAIIGLLFLKYCIIKKIRNIKHSHHSKKNVPATQEQE